MMMDGIVNLIINIINIFNKKIMKQIELNDKHDDKIIEMYKSLSPEIKNIVRDPCFPKTFQYWFNIDNGTNRVHWLELLWIILDKISNKLSPIQIKKLVVNFSLVCFNRFDSIHPVDYLYDKFIQIKKDETTKSH